MPTNLLQFILEDGESLLVNHPTQSNLKIGEINDMFNFFKKDHPPRLAYREQRDGKRLYYVETWHCYESGCLYSQESPETYDIEMAKRFLKDISDKEIVSTGIIE